MYMMTMKNRRCEYSAVNALADAGYFQDGLFPLVEVIQQEVEYDDLVDPKTGECIKENNPYKSGAKKGQDRWRKVKDPSTARDVTLRNIEKRFRGNCIFVDYFRCDMGVYKDADYANCSLVINLSNHTEA